MNDKQIVEKLKDTWHELEADGRSLMAVSVTERKGSDGWRTITVRDPTWLDEHQADGFVTVIRDGGL